MIDLKHKKGMILNELDSDNTNYWFDLKQKKFLHNIDTFYYSIKLENDFTKDSQDSSCLALRKYFNKFKLDFDTVVPFDLNVKDVLNIRNFSFGGFYNICIECPEYYDIFIADTVPSSSSGLSVTSEIIVQIRSYLLWTKGVTKAFDDTFETIKAFCNKFDLEILEVKENRIDYCWHTNYLQNSSEYFRIDNFSKMQVSRYKRIHYEYQFMPNDEYENDYICLGKRSDKCFVRIYLKSKEVVERGYKPWFFKFWLFNGLINRYDNYVYEECFRQGKWHYLDVARLKFYSEYGTNQEYIKECKDIVCGAIDKNADYINVLANILTPSVTMITNIEFQTMRRSTKSYKLLQLKDNSKYGVAKRIYDYFDNRKLITDYLTHSTLRLVDVSTDSNKSRADYTAFWKALRNTKQVDVSIPNKDLKLIREYTRQLNKEVLKKRMLNSVITYGFYTKGMNDDDVIDDCANAILKLNDNDIFNMKRYKAKKSRLLNAEELTGMIETNDLSYQIINSDTGEFI